MRRRHKGMNTSSSFNLNGQNFNSQLKSKPCDYTQHSLLTICLRAPHLKRACTWQEMQCLPFILSETFCDPVVTAVDDLRRSLVRRLQLNPTQRFDNVTSCQPFIVPREHEHFGATLHDVGHVYYMRSSSHIACCGGCQ